MKMKTEKGTTTFTALVAIEKKNVTVEKREGRFYALENGEYLGEIVGDHVMGTEGKNKGVKIALEDLIPSIDGADLVGKDPADMTKEELIAYAEYLQNQAGVKPVAADKKAEKKAEKVEATEEITLETLKAMKIKPLIEKAKELGIEGITSRSKKDDVIAAIAEKLGLTESDEEEDEEEEMPKAKGKKSSSKKPVEEDEEEDDEDEDDEDEEESDDEEDDSDEEDESDEDDEEDEEEDDEEEDEDSDDDDEEEEDDDEDEEDDDEDDEDEEEEEEDDENDEDDDEEEDEDDDEDELTPEDIDAIKTKEEIMPIIKQYKIKLPKNQKLKLSEVKKIVKKAIFG
jgi:hypothetical protein